MFGFAILVMLFLGMLTWFIGSTFIKNRKLLAALTLTTMLMNSGAYGLSLNRLAFGDEALAYASLYFVGMVMLSYTIGVIVASLGTVGWKEAVLELIKIPTIYAMALGFIFITFGWQLPEPLMISISSLSDAAIPGLLVLLGVQLQKLQGSSLQLGPLLFANLMRLGGGLVFGFMVSAVLGLESVAHQAGVVESAMPTAVTSIVLATEYDVEPDFVTMVVFTSTLLSPLTLTPLLFYLSL